MKTTSNQIPVDGIAIFELGENEILETLEEFDAVEDGKSKPEPATQKQPEKAKTTSINSSQPVFEELDGTQELKATPEDFQEVQFGTDDVLEGAMTTSTARASALEALDADEPEDDKGVVSTLLKNYKLVIGGLVLGMIGWVMIPSSKVTIPVTQTSGIQSQATTTASSTATSPSLDVATHPGGQTVGAESPALDIASMGASPDDQARLSAEMDTDLKAIPPREQTCSNPALTSFDQRQCARYTAQMFFKCTEGVGRRWNVTIAGCEQI